MPLCCRGLAAQPGENLHLHEGELWTPAAFMLEKTSKRLTSAVDETVVPTPGGRLQLAAPFRL